MTTPTGELLANITSSVAQWERRIIGVRTSQALQVLKAAVFGWADPSSCRTPYVAASPTSGLLVTRSARSLTG